ncbi:MAG: adenylate/guanylate cyclase domain-containing protein [Pseudomonadota bacterium]
MRIRPFMDVQGGKKNTRRSFRTAKIEAQVKQKAPQKGSAHDDYDGVGRLDDTAADQIADRQVESVLPTKSPALSSPATRKQVTVLFCDLADYTSRSLQMDPEDLASDIRVFQSLCCKVAEHFQGHVLNYLGDGLMVVFGHPYANEFAPERAVRAGLEMVSVIRQNNETDSWSNRDSMHIRVGIATGLVVVGERGGTLGDQDEQIFGEAPNLAARLQSLATPDSVVASHSTRRLLGNRFKFRDLGNHQLKGFDQLVSAWEILAPRDYKRHQNTVPGRPIARFVSREEELEMLSKQYQQAIYGFSRYVHIRGEPGIGKSRLIRVFERTIHTQNLYRMRINCSPYFQTSPFRPIKDEFMRWLQLSERDDLVTRQSSIDWALTVLNISDYRSQSLLYELMGTEPPDRVPPLDIDGEMKHRLTIRMLIKIVVRLSKVNPVLMVVEDVHWADASTIAVLNELLNRVRHEALFGIIIARPEFKPNWKPANCISRLDLKGLSDADAGELVQSVFDQEQLPTELKSTLVRKGDGIPLFLEESSITALTFQKRSRQGLDPRDSFEVPETLQDSLNARLDQLGKAKAFAQLAATFGQDFTYEIISQVADQNNIDADRGMDALLDANLLIVNQENATERYQFRHVMFQEAAYHSLLIKARQRYHQQIADLFQQIQPGLSDTNPELLAYHYSKTDSLDIAVRLWMKAGRQAIAKSAVIEALDHLRQGQTLLRALPSTDHFLRCELDLLLSLGVALTARSGYFGAEVEETYRKASELAGRVGDLEQQWTAVYGLWRCVVAQADYQRALKLSAKLHKLSEGFTNPEMQMTAVGIRGISRMVAGGFTSASRLFKKSMKMHKQGLDKNTGMRFGQDPYVTILGLCAVNNLITDNVTEAMDEINRSVESARQVGHPYTIAEALRTSSMFEQLTRNLARLKKSATEAKTLSEQYGFDGLLSASNIFLAFGDIVAYKRDEDIAIIIENLNAYQEKYSLMFLPYFHGILAEAYLITDQFANAFNSAEEVLGLINSYGEEWSASLMLSIKAEAAYKGKLASDDHISTWVNQAVALAEKQHAWFFLRRILNSRLEYCDDLSEITRIHERLDDLSRGDISTLLLDRYTIQEH